MKIVYDRHKVAEFCQRHRIRRLSFFGSVLRDDFSPASDVDVLVELEPGHRIGLLGFSRIERELSEILGVKVDLNTEGFISRHLLDDILHEAQVQYVAA